MHDERLADQTHEWAAWRTPTRIRDEDLVIPEPKHACADINWRVALTDPWFYAVVLGFVYGLVYTVVMYVPAWCWSKLRRQG